MINILHEIISTKTEQQINYSSAQKFIKYYQFTINMTLDSKKSAVQIDSDVYWRCLEFDASLKRLEFRTAIGIDFGGQPGHVPPNT